MKKVHSSALNFNWSGSIKFEPSESRGFFDFSMDDIFICSVKEKSDLAKKLDELSKKAKWSGQIEFSQVKDSPLFSMKLLQPSGELLLTKFTASSILAENIEDLFDIDFSSFVGKEWKESGVQIPQQHKHVQAKFRKVSASHIEHLLAELSKDLHQEILDEGEAMDILLMENAEDLVDAVSRIKAPLNKALSQKDIQQLKILLSSVLIYEAL